VASAYQQITAEALHLHQFGLTNFDVARQFGVNDKTEVPGIEENSYFYPATIHCRQPVTAIG
jgi:hypothetical protein